MGWKCIFVIELNIVSKLVTQVLQKEHFAYICVNYMHNLHLGFMCNIKLCKMLSGIPREPEGLTWYGML